MQRAYSKGAGIVRNGACQGEAVVHHLPKGVENGVHFGLLERVNRTGSLVTDAMEAAPLERRNRKLPCGTTEQEGHRERRG